MTNIELVNCLCLVSVPLREAHRIHLRAYGTLVPHVFMADVLKRIGELVADPAMHPMSGDGPEVREILEVLEEGMTQGDRETRNVIALSFTRDSELEPFFVNLMPLLGPRTRAQMRGR